MDLIIGTSAGFERIIVLLEDFDRIIGSDLRIPGSLTSSCVTGFEKAFRISSAEGISLDGVELPDAFLGSTTRGRSAFAAEFTLALGVAVFTGVGFADGETAGVDTGAAFAAVGCVAVVFVRWLAFWFGADDPPQAAIRAADAIKVEKSSFDIF